jgi:hypothetical protein
MRLRRSPKAEFVKVQFYDPVVGYENLWADELSGNNYRIESTPFFIYGISRHDIVAASPDAEGRLQFVQVVSRSGNRTLRARSDEFISNAAFRKRVIRELKKRGCDVEELRSRLLSIDVPPPVNMQTVTDYLTNIAKVDWEFGNPESLNKNSVSH